ncbi:MAG: hypothetical protein AAGH15_18960 [Myxococcota bacterium]
MVARLATVVAALVLMSGCYRQIRAGQPTGRRGVAGTYVNRTPGGTLLYREVARGFPADWQEHDAALAEGDRVRLSDCLGRRIVAELRRGTESLRRDVYRCRRFPDGAVALGNPWRVRGFTSARVFWCMQRWRTYLSLGAEEELFVRSRRGGACFGVFFPLGAVNGGGVRARFARIAPAEAEPYDRRTERLSPRRERERR